jgi:hypothetical protein
MKFYDCATAPSPRRVRIFLAKKGITVPKVQVDLRNNEQLTPAFRAINPDASAEEKAVITAWQRISERNGFYAVM